MNLPGRVNIVGTEVSTCDAATALDLLDQRLREHVGGYVCFTNVHSVVAGRRDPEFQSITNGSFLSLSDGKPVYWMGKAMGAVNIGHVPGPDFLIAALRRFPRCGHFFYGSSPEVLTRLISVVGQAVSGLKICGSLSPPFRPLTAEEKLAHYQTIRDSGAGFVWVGLGAPKQEQWMADACQHLGACIAFGVGAAFDFHAGTVRRAPSWIRYIGLEWLFRLLQEPRRLWKRYLVTNSLFVYYVIREHLGSTKWSHRDSAGPR